MDMPEMLRGDSPVRLFQGALAGAVATMVIGFAWGGWMLGSTATKMVDEASRSAVMAALAPICVDKFQHASNAAENLALLKKTASYQQGSFVDKGGWATLPGGDASNYALSQACATALADAK
jgi:hypothetical protein